MIRNVVIVSDVRLHRDGLARFLIDRGAFGAVHDVATRDELLALVRRLQPEIVLLDTATRGGLEWVRLVALEAPACKVVAFAVAELPQHVIACAEAGVAGYVPADASVDDLIAVVRGVARGELSCPPGIASTLFRRLGAINRTTAPPVNAIAPTVRGPLTHREREILAMIEVGLSNKEIAQALGIGVPTVKNHVHSILAKLNVARRGEAAARHRRRDTPPQFEAVR